MKYLVIWSEFSENKLDEIFDYYNNRASYKIAKKLITEIIAGTVILETNPLAGPVELLLNDRTEEYHYLVCGNYKVIYSVDKKTSWLRLLTCLIPDKIQRKLEGRNKASSQYVSERRA